MPVPERDFVFQRDAIASPAGAGQFIAVAIIAVLHDKVDSRTFVSVVIIVALPKRAERIDRGLPIVPKVVRQDFKVRSVHIAAKWHATIKRLAIVDDWPAVDVDHRIALSIFYLLAGVSKIPVQLAVRAEQKRVS